MLPSELFRKNSINLKFQLILLTVGKTVRKEIKQIEANKRKREYSNAGDLLEEGFEMLFQVATFVKYY